MFTPPAKLPVQPPPVLKQPEVTGSHPNHGNNGNNNVVNHALSSSQSAPSLSSMGGRSGSGSGETTSGALGSAVYTRMHTPAWHIHT